jgi:hypothetical protein
MNEYAIASKFKEDHNVPEENQEKYYSVEIPIRGLGVIYQFKTRNIEPMFMSILIKKNSRILPWIKVGDRLNMKYYSTRYKYRYCNFDTEIRFITIQEHGRLKGHYLVGIEIIERHSQEEISWPYRTDGVQVFNFLNESKNNISA